jgi:hypothetical protein
MDNKVVIDVNKNYLKASEEFSENASAGRMILRSFKLILPHQGNRFGLLISMIIAAIFAFIIGTSVNTVDLLFESANTILNMKLAIFAVVLTVYSIIFVFFDDAKLKIFAENKDSNSGTFLNITAIFYQSVMFLYFLSIAITGMIVLLMGIINNDFRLTDNLYFNRWLAKGLLFVYFTFSFRIFYELKSIIYNTIQLFRLGVLVRLKKYSQESNNDDSHDDE